VQCHHSLACSTSYSLSLSVSVSLSLSLSLSSTEPDESSSLSPKTSFVLIPLRRNPQHGQKDLMPSPRRPKTAVDDEEFLAKFRQETWEALGEDPPGTVPGTGGAVRGKSTEGGANDPMHMRLRQSTGSLSARLHPLKKQENNDSSPASPHSSLLGLHSARSHPARKSHNNTSSTWTEQVDEAKEALEAACFVESGKHHPSKTASESSRMAFVSASDLPGPATNRPKHSQLHLAGTSSLKSHTPTLSISSASQPSTPTQSRRKYPSAPPSSSAAAAAAAIPSTHRPSDRSPSPAIAISGQAAGVSDGTPLFLSSTSRQHSARGSCRFTKLSGEPSSMTVPNKGQR
jgi:hypothetical protein